MVGSWFLGMCVISLFPLTFAYIGFGIDSLQGISEVTGSFEHV